MITEGHSMEYEPLDEKIHKTGVNKVFSYDDVEQFRTICDMLPVALLMYQDDFWIYANHAAEQLTGFSANELLKQKVWEIVHRDYRDLARTNARMRQNGGNAPKLYEVKISPRDGLEKWIQVRATTVISGGRIAGLVAIVDITDRKIAEGLLFVEKERFQAFMDNTPACSWLKDDTGHIVYLNSSFETEFNISASDWLGKTNFDIYPAGIAEDLSRNDRLVLDSNKPIRIEEKTIAPDGNQHFWMTCKFPFHDANHRRYIGGISFDITSMKNLEEELRKHRDSLEALVDERTAEMKQEMVRRQQKEEQYLAFVESIKGWVWEVNPEFIHTYISSTVYDITGYRPEEFLGKMPAAWVPSRERKRLSSQVAQFFVEKKPIVGLETVMLHKDGHQIPIEVNGVPIFDNEGNLLCYRGSCHDITIHKRTLDALREREEELISKSKTLEEVNSTLRILLKQMERDRRDLEDKFVSNIKEMVLPYIRLIQKDGLGTRQKAHLDIINTNLNEILSPFLNTIRQLGFTPREMEVALFVKEGKTTRQIAEMMGVATSAIDSHRNKIREKLGLNKKKFNLRSYLLSLKE